MQPNKIMYIDLPDPLPKSYAPKKGEEMNRSTYSTMRYIDVSLVLVYGNIVIFGVTNMFLNILIRSCFSLHFNHSEISQFIFQ